VLYSLVNLAKIQILCELFSGFILAGNKQHFEFPTVGSPALRPLLLSYQRL